MEKVSKRLDKDEIIIANVLLLFVIYFPDYPPLKSFTNISFQGRRDFITLVENGSWIFAEIDNCSPEKIQFFNEKIREMPEFKGDFSIENNVTRLCISLAESI